MSSDAANLPPTYRFPPPPPPPRSGGSGFKIFLVILLLMSAALNFLLCLGIIGQSAALAGDDGGSPLQEKFVSGSRAAPDKVAVVSLDGTILEGLLTFVHKQVDAAARDNAVKAVVLHINSPGGTITASDDLLRRFNHLRLGTTPKYAGRTFAKPVVVAMGSLCASGGYYAAMAAVQEKEGQVRLFAEPTTLTGSIGVYASLPNAKQMADKIGFQMEMIKAGDIKGSGSMFHELTPQERQPWQDMVENAYARFISVVETGRPSLKGQLADDLFPPRPVARFDARGNPLPGDGEKPAMYTRKRADGGVFTADEALKYGLIDAIGTTDDAIAEVAKAANLTEFRAVRYDRPVTLISALSGDVKAATPDVTQVLGGLGPRVWYLVPQAEFAARFSR